MKTCGTGWLSWDEARAAMVGWQGVWVDLAGPHLGPLPDQAPHASHIWAWCADSWARIRVDEGEAVIGRLHPDDFCPAGGTACQATVVSQVRQAGTWSEPHIRVADMAGKTWEICEAAEGVSALFVRLAQA